MTDDPKPCPFCGRAPWLQAQQGNNPEPFAWDVVHHCRDGFIRFDPRDRNYRSTKAEAIAAWNTRADPSVQEAAGILEQVEAVEDAYTRWMLSRSVGDPDMEHREAQRLSSALFALFNGGPEPDDKPCALVAALRAIAEGRE